MRAIILILVLVVVALIAAVWSGFLDIDQTRSARVPDVSANAEGVTAAGGQAPAFDIETGEVAVGTRPQNVTVRVPTVEVRSPQENRAASNAAN